MGIILQRIRQEWGTGGALLWEDVIYILLTISDFQNDKNVYILPQEYVREFPVDLQPPIHMAITYGPVKIVNKKDNNKEKGSQETEDCLPAFGGLPRCNVCSKKTKVTSFLFARRERFISNINSITSPLLHNLSFLPYMNDIFSLSGWTNLY